MRRHVRQHQIGEVDLITHRHVHQHQTDRLLTFLPQQTGPVLPMEAEVAQWVEVSAVAADHTAVVEEEEDVNYLTHSVKSNSIAL